MKFAEVIGQKNIKAQIIRLVHEGRMPHALMLTGAAGCGKLPLAIAAAQFLCCEKPSDVDSCGLCSSCVKFAKLSHPDLHFTFPIVQNVSKGISICNDVVQEFRVSVMDNPYINLSSWLNVISDGKTGVIYKSEGDEMIRKLSLKPYESKYQVMILWAPERMNDECANHLLKFIEEPPANTFFILVSDNEDEVLRTIHSRTQKIYVPPISMEELMEKAREVYNMPEDQILLTARLARGSWNNFMSELSASDEKRELFQNFVAMMRISWALNMKELRAWSEKMASYNRDTQRIFLQLAQNQIRENFIARLHASELSYMNGEENDFATKFSRFIHENNIEGMMAALQLAEEQIEQNANSKIVFFHLPFILYRLIKQANN